MSDNAKRPPTTFRVFVRPKGTEPWTLLDLTETGRTQDEAKRKAARLLEDDPTYRPYILGDGLELFVAAARSIKPALVKVQPQPSKVKLDDFSV
jgi:hypothetical protein